MGSKLCLRLVSMSVLLTVTCSTYGSEKVVVEGFIFSYSDFADLLKVGIPLITALVAIWVRSWFQDRKERKAKKEALWKVLKNEIVSLRKTCDQLENHADAARNGSGWISSTHVPIVATDLAKRLSELEPSRSHLYSDYVGFSKILDDEMDFLRELTKIKVQDTLKNETIDNATLAQVEVLQLNLCIHADNMLSLMTHIRTEIKGDTQDISNAKMIVSEVKHRKPS